VSPSEKKVVLNMQPYDLGMSLFSLLDLSLGRTALLVAREYISHPLDGLPFPRADLARAQLVDLLRSPLQSWGTQAITQIRVTSVGVLIFLEHLNAVSSIGADRDRS